MDDMYRFVFYSLVGYYSFILHGIVAEVRLLSNLSSNWKFIAKILKIYFYYRNLILTLACFYFSGFNNENSYCAFHPSQVLYALLQSVLLYFSCSLEKFEFVKWEVEC